MHNPIQLAQSQRMMFLEVSPRNCPCFSPIVLIISRRIFRVSPFTTFFLKTSFFKWEIFLFFDLHCRFRNIIQHLMSQILPCCVAPIRSPSLHGSSVNVYYRVRRSRLGTAPQTRENVQGLHPRFSLNSRMNNGEVRQFARPRECCFARHLNECENTPARKGCSGSSRFLAAKAPVANQRGCLETVGSINGSSRELVKFKHTSNENEDTVNITANNITEHISLYTLR